jgi:hypothetical protein
MPDWLERAVTILVGALTVVLVAKYRDRGLLRQIGKSKHRFRNWLKDRAAP